MLSPDGSPKPIRWTRQRQRAQLLAARKALEQLRVGDRESALVRQEELERVHAGRRQRAHVRGHLRCAAAAVSAPAGPAGAWNRTGHNASMTCASRVHAGWAPTQSFRRAPCMSTRTIPQCRFAGGRESSIEHAKQTSPHDVWLRRLHSLHTSLSQHNHTISALGVCPKRERMSAHWCAQSSGAAYLLACAGPGSARTSRRGPDLGSASMTAA